MSECGLPTSFLSSVEALRATPLAHPIVRARLIFGCFSARRWYGIDYAGRRSRSLGTTSPCCSGQRRQSGGVDLRSTCEWDRNRGQPRSAVLVSPARALFRHYPAAGLRPDPTSTKQGPPAEVLSGRLGLRSRRIRPPERCFVSKQRTPGIQGSRVARRANLRQGVILMRSCGESRWSLQRLRRCRRAQRTRSIVTIRL